MMDKKKLVTHAQAVGEFAQKVFAEILKMDNPPKIPKSRQYPESVAECINDEIKYKKGVDKAMKDFRDANPWKGTLEERQDKFIKLNSELAKVYDSDEPKLVFVNHFPTGPCCFPTSNPPVIMMEKTSREDYSVIAFLHEFAHTLSNWIEDESLPSGGKWVRKGEKAACTWSLNLFKRYFPKAYGKLEPRGHMLYRRETEEKQAAK